MDGYIILTGLISFAVFIFVFFIPWVVGLSTLLKMVSKPKKAEGQSAAEIAPEVRVAPEPQILDKVDVPTPSSVASSTNVANTDNMVADDTSSGFNDQFKKLGNINIFLYIGSFLVIVAAAVFIGMNYGTLSGIFKTCFFGGFALLFYLLGLLFYLKFPKIKPAGLTFATIGLVLAPLVGLTYYKFVAYGQNGFVIWFTTSIVVFILYFISLKVIKKVFLAYFLSFVSLSLFESFISLFNVPMYYFGWGMSLASMIFLIISKGSADENVKKTFYVSANIFLPVALILSVIAGDQSGWSQLGINLIFSSAFYFMASIYEKVKISVASVYFMIALIILPIGLLIWMGDKNFSNSLVATIFAVLAGLYVIVFESIKNVWQDERPKISLIVAGILATLISLTIEGKNLVIITLIYAMVVNFYGLYRSKLQICFGLAMFNLLYLPYAIISPLRLANSKFVLEAQIYVGSYIAIGLIILAIRENIVKWSENLKPLAIIAYFAAFIIALGYCVGISSSNIFIMSILLTMAAIFTYISYLEKADWLIAISALFIHLAFLRFVPIFGLKDITNVAIMATSGSVLFALSLVGTGYKAKVLAYSGLIWVFFGAIYGLNFFHEVVSILVLLFSGVLLMVQAYKQKSDILSYFAGAIMVLASLWWMNYCRITETQVYTLIISAYFAVISYLRYKKNDNQGKDALAIFSLMFLTIPLFIQSWGSDNGTLRSLVLGGEGLALIFIGIGSKYELMRKWGVGTLVAAVLYLTVIALSNFPVWAVIGVVGIVLLVLAIFLLNKGHDQDKA